MKVIYSETLPVAFDVIDAAIFEHLRPLIRGVFETERIAETPARVRYVMRSKTFGHLGEVGAQELGDHRTEVFVTAPEGSLLPQGQDLLAEILDGFFSRFHEEQDRLGYH